MKHLERIRTISMLALLAVILAFCNCERLNLRNSENTEESDSLLVTDTTDESMTIQEWIKWREDIRMDKFNDSVFLAIPEPTLTFLLVQCGTNVTVADIVAEYVTHQRFYDETVLPAMLAQKRIDIDSLPKLPKIDSICNPIDSIPKPVISK
jgi:hypothetical protein